MTSTLHSAVDQVLTAVHHLMRGTATIAAIEQCTGLTYQDRTGAQGSLAAALNQARAEGLLAVERDNDVLYTARYLLTDAGRRRLGTLPTELIDLHLAARALRAAAETVERMADAAESGARPLHAAPYDIAADRVAAGVARLAEAALAAGHVPNRPAFRDQVAAGAGRRFVTAGRVWSVTDTRRLD